MQALQQRNNRDCLITSAAMVLGKSIEEVESAAIAVVGFRPVDWSIQDIIRAYWRDWSFTEFSLRTLGTDDEHVLDFNKFVVAHVLPENLAILSQWTPEPIGHALAWSGSECFDPRFGHKIQLPTVDAVWVISERVTRGR